MATVAASLSTLLRIENDITFNTLQLSSISSKYDATHKKLEKMLKYEEKWQQAFEDAQDVDKTCKIGNKTWKEKDHVLSDEMADKYAHAKVQAYDEDILRQLTEEDMNFDAVKCTLETALTKLQAEKESWKQKLTQDAQDTCETGK